MKFRYFSTIVASLVVSVFGIATAAADVLETVKERGTLFCWGQSQLQALWVFGYVRGCHRY